jgi:hypothetical protein
MSKAQRTDVLDHAVLLHGDTPLQLVRWKGERVQVDSISTASAATALPTGTKIAEVRADEDCYLRFGGVSVAATQDLNSILFLRGVQTVAIPLDTNNNPYTHVSVIRKSTSDGVVQIERVN